MPIYVDQHKFTGENTIKVNSISDNCDQRYQIQKNSIQNNSFPDYPSKSSQSKDNALSLQKLFPAGSSALPCSKQDSDLKVFLDMDGVLTDFAGACEKLNEHMMCWYASDRERFWKRIVAAGTNFWSDMPWIAGGKELHGFLKSSGLDPTILSALPSPDRKMAMINAKKGKMEWLRKELGTPYANNAILCFRPEKALQSGISRILIDDNQDNIHEWEEAGGLAILHMNANRTIRCLGRIVKEEQKT